MIELFELHRAWRAAHIALGFLGLVLFWVPLVATKGSRTHVLSGRLFAICAYLVAGTGLLSSVWGVVDPSSFLESTRGDSSPIEPKPRNLEDIRFIFSITGFLSLAVLTGLTLGIGVMRAGERHESLRSPWLLSLTAAVGVWAAGLAIYGATSLATGYAGWHFLAPSESNRYWINLSLGVFGVWGTIGDLAYLRGPCPPRLERWTMHVQCMVGAGAGFYAAFFLFGASRLIGLSGIGVVLAALAPLVIASFVVKRVVRAEARRESGRALDAPS
ncbi:MAG: hypothetical protein FJ253_01540 [Phycisphaerae bacterium]|nr:hypothetical protein [Phycisphaerae bacterium]